MRKVAAHIVISMILLVAIATGVQSHVSTQHFAAGTLFQAADAFDGDSSHTDDDTTASLPLRLSASEFQHQKQLSPEYELAIEFLAEDLSAKHFVYIHTIPDVQPWFELAAFVPNKMRLSGWKDSRPLNSHSLRLVS